MDVVYALGRGSHWGDNELRYSLRSINKYLSNYSKVWIIGDVPRFPIHNINFLAYKENSLYPAVNIMNKLTLACTNENISDRFLFFNDDHFLLNYYDAYDFPFYYCGDLKDVVNKTVYIETIKNTIHCLHDNDLPTKNFDIHTPIVYHKKLFLEIINKYNWDVNHGLCIKSLYCNTLKINGSYMEDGKIRRSKDEDQLRHWLANHSIFSVSDECLNNTIKKRFDIIYPKKSKYED